MRTVYLTAVAFLAGLVILQPAARADVQMHLLGSGNGGDTMGNVYTSPYSFSIDGSASDMLLICDDFQTNINFGYSWPAKVYPLSAAGSLLAKFTTPGVTIPDATGVNYAGDIGAQALNQITVQEKYNAAGLLAQDLLDALPNPSTTANQIGEYSYAIWQIFDPTAYLGYPDGSGSVAAQFIGSWNDGLGTIANLEYNALLAAVNGAKPAEYLYLHACRSDQLPLPGVLWSSGGGGACIPLLQSDRPFHRRLFRAPPAPPVRVRLSFVRAPQSV